MSPRPAEYVLQRHWRIYVRHTFNHILHTGRISKDFQDVLGRTARFHDGDRISDVLNVFKLNTVVGVWRGTGGR